MAKPTNCKCEDWELGMKQVNAPAMYLFARNPQHYPQDENGVHQLYNGPVFKYCPWCGEELEIKNG